MTRLPRVTEILSIMDNAYADVPRETLQRAAERGSALHGICCQHLASMMDLCPKPSAIDADYTAGYMGFLEWVAQRNVTPLLVEATSTNEKDGYTGTPDALVTYGDGTVVLPDLKFTASVLRINRVQVQAYLKLPDYTQAKKAVLIHINHQTGHWEEVPVQPNPRDWVAFKSALSLYHWRQS